MKPADLAHRALVASTPLAHKPGLRRVWHPLKRRAERRWGDAVVRTVLHGQQAFINFQNPYPFAVRLYPNYNAPQVELIKASAQALGRPVHVVDIGAAVGDTALLILTTCDQELASLACVEGDASFFELLQKNLSDRRVRLHREMLSSHREDIPTLQRSQHAGTSSSHGPGKVRATTLDDLIQDGRVDVLKLDTDGFDGKILAGSTRVLDKHHPAVLFEWHPKLCQLVGVDAMLPFEVLRPQGYVKWIFFNKFGQFSHFGDNKLEEYLELALTSTTLDDWHYDVVALHESSPVAAVAVADLQRWGRAGYW